MSHDVIVGMVDRDGVRTDVYGGVWFTTGVPERELLTLQASGADAQSGGRLATAHPNSTVVFLELHDDRPTRVFAWRGLLSLADLYYSAAERGPFVLSDHIRNVVAHVPLPDRRPDDDALLEHYLCGWVFDRRTMCGGVARVAPGDSLFVDVGTGKRRHEVFDRITAVADPDGLDGLPDAVEAALEEVIGPMRGADGVCVTFSGGVDSTLLASFFDERSSLVTMTTDSPEFVVETEYARAAARQLDRSMTEEHVEERDYVELLEDAVDTMATPPGHYVMPLFGRLYDRPEDSFVLGEGADSVFGTDRGLRRIAGALSHRPGLLALSAMQSLPGAVGYRSSQILGYARSYARPTNDVRGSAGTSLRFGDGGLVEAIVGPDAVDGLLGDHLRFVSERVDIETPESMRFHRHNEIVRWRTTMGNIGTSDRLLAIPRGKRIVQPFVDPEVVLALRRAPADRRYVRRLAGKWVLKDILSRRVPGYPVNQRKNATGIPFERYCVDGPLQDIWDRYDIPDFIPADLRRRVVDDPSPLSWYALTHAIWSERIATNPTLRPHRTSVGFISSGPGAGD